MVASSGESGAPRGGSAPRTGVVALPAAWVALSMARAAWGIVASWPATYDFGLPDEVVYWIYAGMAVGLVTILWGAWLLGLAYQRAPGSRRAFVLWQSFVIAAICISYGYTFFSEVFVSSLSGLALPVIEVGVGVALIARARPAAEQTPAAVAAGRPPALVFLINAVLGAIVAAAAGALAGFAIGAWLADVYEVSCFEGGCGYFAAAFGLAGMLAGGVAGAVAAVRLTGRASRRGSG